MHTHTYYNLFLIYIYIICFFVFFIIFASIFIQLTWISSMLCTMNMSCRSSMAPSIQLLKGAALLANSRYSWSIVSHSFSTRWRMKENNQLESYAKNGYKWLPFLHIWLVFQLHVHCGQLIFVFTLQHEFVWRVWSVCAPLERLFSSGSGFPGCPTGHRCPGSGCSL